jgi:hypothetical protein
MKEHKQSIKLQQFKQIYQIPTNSNQSIKLQQFKQIYQTNYNHSNKSIKLQQIQTNLSN